MIKSEKTLPDVLREVARLIVELSSECVELDRRISALESTKRTAKNLRSELLRAGTTGPIVKQLFEAVLKDLES